MLKIAVAQLNYTVGDIDGNVVKIKTGMKSAAKDDADLVVFSELSLCGYYPADMFLSKVFTDAVFQGLANIVKASTQYPSLFTVVGGIDHNTGPGKSFHNALFVIHNGTIVTRYYKQLLPTYDVFDERRHFEPGPAEAVTLMIKDTNVGFIICEDGWNADKEDYKTNPFDAYQNISVDLIVSINASPSNYGKREKRHSAINNGMRDALLPALLYVNQVGGQDQVVFDGGSFLTTYDHGVIFEAPAFQVSFDLIFFDKADVYLPPTPMSQIDEFNSKRDLSWGNFTKRQIILGLVDYTRRCFFDKVVVGCSGGIDSALTIALAVEALGPENVIAVTMPSQFSSEGSVSDSEALCAGLGLKLYTHPIGDLTTQYGHQFSDAFGKPLQGVALENLQARIRGTILMEYSNTFGAMLLTTGNKSEISVGYCTLYGDTNGGLGLIGDLYKTEIYELCEYLNFENQGWIIPENIMKKEPSAELAPDQKDSDSLPPYEVLDTILKFFLEEFDDSKESSDILNEINRLKKTSNGLTIIGRIKRLLTRNEYKRRQAPPNIRMRSRAFGTGRAMPLAANYHSF